MNEWVPCSERLPDERVDVLFWDARRQEVRLGWRDAWKMDDGSRVPFWKAWGGGSQWEDVTHWMPLPEGPK